MRIYVTREGDKVIYLTRFDAPGRDYAVTYASPQALASAGRGCAQATLRSTRMCAAASSETSRATPPSVPSAARTVT